MNHGISRIGMFKLAECVRLREVSVTVTYTGFVAFSGYRNRAGLWSSS